MLLSHSKKEKLEKILWHPNDTPLCHLQKNVSVSLTTQRLPFWWFFFLGVTVASPTLRIPQQACCDGLSNHSCPVLFEERIENGRKGSASILRMKQKSIRCNQLNLQLVASYGKILTIWRDLYLFTYGQHIPSWTALCNSCEKTFRSASKAECFITEIVNLNRTCYCYNTCVIFNDGRRKSSPGFLSNLQTFSLSSVAVM